MKCIAKYERGERECANASEIEKEKEKGKEKERERERERERAVINGISLTVKNFAQRFEF